MSSWGRQVAKQGEQQALFLWRSRLYTATEIICTYRSMCKHAYTILVAAAQHKAKLEAAVCSALRWHQWRRLDGWVSTRPGGPGNVALGRLNTYHASAFIGLVI